MHKVFYVLGMVYVVIVNTVVVVVVVYGDGGGSINRCSVLLGVQF